MFARTLCLLAAGIVPLIAQQSGPAPEGSEQDRILAKMHDYGDRYIGGLPNFLCEQVTSQFQAGLKSNKWKKGDTLVYSLSFHDGHEQRSVAQVNGKAIDRTKPARWHSPLVSEGEFGALLSTVLGERSQATFTWNRWETVRGRRLAVFDYAVDQAHSTKTLSLSDLGTATLAYFGEIAADPQTGAVWRISDVANDIPPKIRTKTISTLIDYDELTIGENRYLLPLQAVVTVVAIEEKIRNELTFRNYRKFTTDSSITFDK